MTRKRAPRRDLLAGGYFVGDCRALLREIPDDSVHTVVTSPPYWALRDYGVDGQVGLEATPQEYVQTMVEVFREVRRVLRPDGTLWLNLGDTYITNPRGSLGASTLSSTLTNPKRQEAIPRPNDCDPKFGAGRDRKRGVRPNRKMKESRRRDDALIPRVSHAGSNLKHKDMVGIPWRTAFALQDDGWYLRADIIWHKPNPMPESITDRPTKAHEYVFLMSKCPDYFYDHEAIKEPALCGDHPRNGTRDLEDIQSPGQPRQAGFTKTRRNGNKGEPRADVADLALFQQSQEARAELLSVIEDGADADVVLEHAARVESLDKQRALGKANYAGFNDRWNANGATIEMRNKRSVWTIPTQPTKDAHFASFPEKLVEPCVLAGAPLGGIVLDPFGGSGTVGRVAEDLGRRWVLFDLNPEYAKIAAKKTAQAGLFVPRAQAGG